ncbi:MAG TPA: hypothetical protein PKE47_10430 [Verrucomicrobiota bacterium]|nr:hypothetical protein [Verrucomicrobiota bacterium]
MSLDLKPLEPMKMTKCRTTSLLFPVVLVLSGFIAALAQRATAPLPPGMQALEDWRLSSGWDFRGLAIDVGSDEKVKLKTNEILVVKYRAREVIKESVLVDGAVSIEELSKRLQRDDLLINDIQYRVFGRNFIVSGRMGSKVQGWPSGFLCPPGSVVCVLLQ